MSENTPTGAFTDIRRAAAAFFEQATGAVGDGSGNPAWEALSPELKSKSLEITAALADLATTIGPAIRRSPLMSDVDATEAGREIKGMRAALRFRRYRFVDAVVLHDEDRVLGVQAAAEEDHWPLSPADAADVFSRWAESLSGRLELIDPHGSAAFGLELVPPKAAAAGYRPNTAFIMMSMTKDDPHLTDVSTTVKRCFAAFDIVAVRSDDIEHQEVITQRIVDEIRTSEFLIADLTGERPSVYYEVGVAHSLGRRPILYRRSGTPVHFDLAHFNCPEYASLTELEEKLIKRLEALTGRRPRG